MGTLSSEPIAQVYGAPGGGQSQGGQVDCEGDGRERGSAGERGAGLVGLAEDDLVVVDHLRRQIGGPVLGPVKRALVKALEERARSNDPKARLALDVFAISVRKTIGAYLALLGGVDLLVFTGGIGEHSDHVRSSATQGLESLGLTADKVQIVPTQEERQIARHCREMITQHRP